MRSFGGDICKSIIAARLLQGYFCRGAKNNLYWPSGLETARISETGRIWFQTLNSVSFLALTEFQGESSVSSSQPIFCVPKRTQQAFFFRRTHRACRKTQ